MARARIGITWAAHDRTADVAYVYDCVVTPRSDLSLLAATLRDHADNLLALFGDHAYSEAVARARHEDDAGGDSRHWLTLRREIARRSGKPIGLDMAPWYLGRISSPKAGLPTEGYWQEWD